MTDHERPGPTRAEQFGHFIARAARAAGYDIDSPRGGGKKALAEASGMGQTAVGRMLKGESIPDPRFFEDLARAVDLDLPSLLVQSGLASEEAFSVEARPPQVTPEMLARQLGIKTERGVAEFSQTLGIILEGIISRESSSGQGDGKRGAA